MDDSLTKKNTASGKPKKKLPAIVAVLNSVNISARHALRL